MISFSDLLSFEKLVTPTIIKIVYYIAIVLIVISGLIGVFSAFALHGFGSALLALLTTLVGLLACRIYCELVIVLFGLYDRAGEIRDRIGSR